MNPFDTLADCTSLLSPVSLNIPRHRFLFVILQVSASSNTCFQTFFSKFTWGIFTLSTARDLLGNLNDPEYIASDFHLLLGVNNFNGIQKGQQLQHNKFKCKYPTNGEVMYVAERCFQMR